MFLFIFQFSGNNLCAADCRHIKLLFAKVENQIYQTLHVYVTEAESSTDAKRIGYFAMKASSLYTQYFSTKKRQF